MPESNNFQYVLAALVIIAVIVTLVMYSRKQSSTRFRNRATYGKTRLYGSTETVGDKQSPQQEPQPLQSAASLMPSGYKDNTGPITANMVAKLRSAGSAIQSQITHNPLKRTGGYNAVLNLRENPRGPAVSVSRNQPPMFNSSSALEDQNL